MARLLLKLGAVSSQAEHNGTTAFHRYVKDGRVDMVDTLLEHDKTGVKAAINHLIFTGYSWNPASLSPLHTAIELGDIILVLKLLEAGASPEIDFETWLKSINWSPMRDGNFRDLDSNKRLFQTMEQPLLMAVRLGEIGVASELLERGADPNAMTPTSHNLLINAYQRQWNKGESVLDLVQSTIDGFKRHRSTESRRLEKPQKTLGLDLYPENFTPGTFSHAVVTWKVGIAKGKFEEQVKVYEEELKNNDYAAAEDEKNRFLSELIDELEALKRELLAKGAKSFAELHPYVICRDNGSRHESSTTQKKPPLDLYKYVFRFPGDRIMTDKRRDGYVELFEAAWAGNLNRIKDLTLQAWGPEQAQPPLNMAIADSEGNTPFAIAFLRGHHEVAKAILEIVKAQWTPKEEDKVLYKLRTQDDDHDEGDSDDEAYSHNSDDGEPQMVSKKVDRKFTIDNVGQVSMQVESHVLPLDVITATQRTFVVESNGFRDTGCRSLFVHCFDMDDSAGLKILLDMAQHWARQNSAKSDEEEPSKNFTLPQGDFQWALDHGKTQVLGLVIKRTGAGIPLDHLVKKSGVEIKSKPRYYQGLTVYGKKR
jgi:ankyrin repeat protein